MHTAPNLYSAVATAVLFLHALLMSGWSSGPCSRARVPSFAGCLSFSCSGGILRDLLPWPCLLTMRENWREQKGGVEPYQGGFLLHYMDKLVYPDVSPTVLTMAGGVVFALQPAISRAGGCG